MPEITGMGVPLEGVGIGDPVIPLGTAAEQVEVKTLLSLALPSPAKGTQAPAKKSVVPATVFVAKPLVRGEWG